MAKKKISRQSTKSSKSNRRTATAKMDIIRLIMEDHKPVKRLLRILKNSDNSLGERQKAFKEFVPLLLAHSKAEEQTIYTAMKETEKLREEGFEGMVEHTLAEQMVDEAKRSDDVEKWSAQVKVLAELVEHHIKEEEQDMLPDFRKACDAEERERLGQAFLLEKENVLPDGTEKNPRLQPMKEQNLHS